MSVEEWQTAASMGAPWDGHTPTCPTLEREPGEEAGEPPDIVDIAQDAGGGGPPGDPTRELSVASPGLIPVLDPPALSIQLPST